MMFSRRDHVPLVRAAILLVLAGLLGQGQPARAQVPGVPAAPASKKAGDEEKTKSAVATTSGPIAVRNKVSDDDIQEFLGTFLPKYPGVEELTVTVKQGVVTLGGRVDDDDTRSEITQVVSKVEGVRMVLNQTATDEETMSGWEYARREAANFLAVIERKWILMLLAIAIVIISWRLAQAFATHSEMLLAPFVQNVLLRSVVGSIISALLVLGGLVLALQALRLTQVVVSVLGVSGLIVLAVGFAFRDITENFIASVLLGLRRPFQIGDYLTIAGQSGVVKSLNTRATVLVTLDGKHVRIPNATIFKEIVINATASPNYRTNFDVVIPYEASTSAAMDAITQALRGTPGILADPPARALVEALEPGGIRLRADFWAPTHNVDWFQLMSEAKLRVKVALQQAGILGAPAPAHATQAEERPSGRSTEELASANLERDAHAARNVPSPVVESSASPTARVLQEPETRVSNEGANLLKNARSE